MAIAGQPFSLTASGNPSFTLQAANINLKNWAAVVVENRGPGACGVWPAGSTSGPPLEVVGAYQRKYVMLGGVDTVCFGLIAPLDGSIGETFYQNNLYASMAGCDDYSLAGTPDYARGALAIVEYEGFGVTASQLQATDVGMDRIRGIYIPPQPTQYTPEVYLGGGNGFIPILSELGMSMQMAISELNITMPHTTAPNFSTLIFSDQPILAGGAGGGTYG